MYSEFRERTEAGANQAPKITMRPKMLRPNDRPTTVVEEEVSGGLLQLTEEENELQKQKQRLIEIMDELENRLTVEIKRKKSMINSLRAEVSELKKTCEELAYVLGIPVIK